MDNFQIWHWAKSHSAIPESELRHSVYSWFTVVKLVHSDKISIVPKVETTNIILTLIPQSELRLQSKYRVIPKPPKDTHKVLAFASDKQKR